MPGAAPIADWLIVAILAALTLAFLVFLIGTMLEALGYHEGNAPGKKLFVLVGAILAFPFILYAIRVAVIWLIDNLFS